MSQIVPTNCLARAVPVAYLEPHQVKKWALIALSAIMALGMIFSYALGAPWLAVFLLFVFTLAPLYPLKSTIDDQRERILENPASSPR